MVEDIETVTPTVAIGIGGAGCSVLSTLHDLTTEEGISEKFRFVGIDSNGTDLDANIDATPHEVTKFLLEPPEQWEENQHDYHFLNHKLLPGGTRDLERPGAQTKRRIGRYYVDSHRNFEELRTRLRSVISEFADTFSDFIERQGHQMNIWVINSLSGGTGSGSFPLVSGLLWELTQRMDWSPGSFIIYGLGAHPDFDAATGDYKTAQLNTYAALRDLKVLIGEDADANKEIRLGERRTSLAENGRISLKDYVFDKYFLQPFDQEEMSNRAYRYQLNKASASVPLYFSLIEGQEDWPIQMDTRTNPNERLYTFDTYEVSVPAENLYRYYATSERIDDLETEIADLEREESQVTGDLGYVNDVSRVNIERYIQQYCTEQERDESDARLTEIVPDEIDVPDSVHYEMVEEAKSAVGGLELGEADVDEVVDARYDTEWDNTETDDVDHKDVFRYVFYQMVARKAKEEARVHRLHELVETRWEKYSAELMEEYGWLADQGPSAKWQDCMQKFYHGKIEEAERNIPQGALYAGGLSFVAVIVLMYAWITNLAALQALADQSVELAYLTVSLVQGVIGGALLLTLVFFGYWAYRKWRVTVLEGEMEECAEAYAEYTTLEEIQSTMRDQWDRINLGETQLERRADELETMIEQRERVLRDQETIQAKVEDRLSTFKFEYDRKLAFPVQEPDALLQPEIKAKIYAYIQSHPSIDLEVVNRDIFDEDVDMDLQTDFVEDELEYEQNDPDSITWFMERDHIDEIDISRAVGEIIDEEERLNRSPLQHRTNTNPEVRQILQYVWNPDNTEAITEARGGGDDYNTLIGNYDTNQPNGVLDDEFRVWMLGLYTGIYLENFGLYADIDGRYSESDDGDSRVGEALDVRRTDPNLVTSRFAYPEFFTSGDDTQTDHPLEQNVASYPR